MLKEFAVEPAAVGATARDFHQLIDLFGFHRGRAIARCPANWVDEVARLIDRSEQVSDVTRAALLAKLRRARKSLHPERRHWPAAGRWSDIAFRVNRDRPFHAVVSTEPRDAPNWIVAPDGIDLDDPLLTDSPMSRVRRRPQDLAACAAPLIRASRQIILVDAYFDPFSDRFRSSLRAMLAVVADGNRPLDRLEYHLLQEPGANRDRHLGLPHFIDGCRGALRGVMPAGQSMTFVRWREHNGGEQFHARYVLTEKAALRFDAGLDAGRGNQTTPVNWEPPEEHARLLSYFALDADTFIRETPTIELFANGHVEEID